MHSSEENTHHTTRSNQIKLSFHTTRWRQNCENIFVHLFYWFAIVFHRSKTTCSIISTAFPNESIQRNSILCVRHPCHTHLHPLFTLAFTPFFPFLFPFVQFSNRLTAQGPQNCNTFCLSFVTTTNKLITFIKLFPSNKQLSK